MPFNPAIRGSQGAHFDGCSISIGLEAIPGTVFFNGHQVPFHAGDPWGIHIRPTKHCKHHIHTVAGMGNIIVDGRPIAATKFPALSCGIPIFSICQNVLLMPA